MDNALDELGVSLDALRQAQDGWAQADHRRVRAQIICRLLDAIPLTLGLVAGLLRLVSAGRYIVYMTDVDGVLSRLSYAENESRK
jgi:hypothetical protein